MMLRPVHPDDFEQLSALHGTSFAAAWPPEAIAELLAAPGGWGLVLDDGALQAMVLWRAVGEEAEILTLAVDPRLRRQGLARSLMTAATHLVAQMGARRMFLEVAVDNAAAIGLYASLGFQEVGRRPGYYAGRSGRTDALVLRRDLNSLFANPYPGAGREEPEP